MLNEIKKIFNFFSGKKFSNEEILGLFNEYRFKGIGDQTKKQQIINSGIRSQYSHFSSYYKWIIIQTFIWIWILSKYEIFPFIHLVAFLTILNQFIIVTQSMINNKKELFFKLIKNHIQYICSTTGIIEEYIDLYKNEGGNLKIKKGNILIGRNIEWTNVTIQIIKSPYNDIPYFRTIVGYDVSGLINLKFLGLTLDEDKNEVHSSLFLLHIFSYYQYLKLESNLDKNDFISKRIDILNENFKIYFGKNDVEPIVFNEKKSGWECFINIDDRTKLWEEIKLESQIEKNKLINSWTEKITDSIKSDTKKYDIDNSYRMKGYEW